MALVIKDGAYNDQQLREMISNGKMTHDIWIKLTGAQRLRVRDERNLCKALRGYEGCRVQAVINGETVRFNVGVSTGWCPIHLRLHNANSSGGDPIVDPKSVTDVKHIRGR